MKRLLTIDPGIGSTGWALWNFAKLRRPAPPLAYGLVKETSREKDLIWFERAAMRSRQLATVVGSFARIASMEVLCEMPVFFGSSAAGHAAAGSGSLEKLCYLVGCYSVAFQKASSFTPIPVVLWKGQLPKEEVERRAIKRLGEKACEGFRADVWDAVGIGLWKGGHL